MADRPRFHASCRPSFEIHRPGTRTSLRPEISAHSPMVSGSPRPATFRMAKRLTILTVAGRGEPLTIGECAEISGLKLVRVPGRWISKLGLQLAWKLGLSAIPPEIAPYVTGECIMNTERLRTFLGHDYEDVIRYTIQDAFVESLAGIVPSAAVEQSVGK